MIDAFSVKPLDEETILASARKTGRVVVAEEHSVMGGLGSAVADVLARRASCALRVRRRAATSSASRASSSELLGYFHLDAAAIVEAVKKVMAR